MKAKNTIAAGNIYLKLFSFCLFVAYKKQCLNVYKKKKKCLPVYIPAKGVFTPLAPPTAALEKDAFTGYDPNIDPTMLHSPTATISWDASRTFPLAAGKEKNNLKYFLKEK